MQPNDLNNNLTNMSRLKWACRRGMLELDVLLNNFLSEAYEKLSDEDKILFVDLLGCADPEIFAWIMGSETPSDVGMQKITKMIRDHARNRI